MLVINLKEEDFELDTCDMLFQMCHQCILGHERNDNLLYCQELNKKWPPEEPRQSEDDFVSLQLGIEQEMTTGEAKAARR